METQVDVEKFFKQATAIKQSRAKNYDNGSRSAYEISLGMYSKKNQCLQSTWPLAQKVGRLIEIAENAQEGNFDEEAFKDNLKDLANYAAMAYLYFFKDDDQVESEKVVPAEPQKFMLKTADTPDEEKNQSIKGLIQCKKKQKI